VSQAALSWQHDAQILVAMYEELAAS
jgi:hypothetical protein